jgi:hypothetical protein
MWEGFKEESGERYLKRRVERGERRENSIIVESIKVESGERRENSEEGRGRPPCLTAYLGCMGVQVARCCSGRHGGLPLQFSGWDYCNPAILSPLSTLHSPLSSLLSN